MYQARLASLNSMKLSSGKSIPISSQSQVQIITFCIIYMYYNPYQFDGLIIQNNYFNFSDSFHNNLYDAQPKCSSMIQQYDLCAHMKNDQK